MKTILLFMVVVGIISAAVFAGNSGNTGNPCAGGACTIQLSSGSCSGAGCAMPADSSSCASCTTNSGKTECVDCTTDTDCAHCKSVTPQTICPIMGSPINKNLFIDYNGQRIYVCCNTCVALLKKDPEKYVARLKKDGITLEKTPAEEISQKTCPVMGGAINKDIYTVYKGKKVYFCCAGCPETFNKNPQKYLKKLASEGVTF